MMAVTLQVWCRS